MPYTRFKISRGVKKIILFIKLLYYWERLFSIWSLSAESDEEEGSDSQNEKSSDEDDGGIGFSKPKK